MAAQIIQKTVGSILGGFLEANLFFCYCVFVCTCVFVLATEMKFRAVMRAHCLEHVLVCVRVCVQMGDFVCA